MVLYQTVEDRNNPDYIGENAPFQCIKGNAWLGVGYYFWDTFLENAHWWGKTNYNINGYVIFRFECDDKSDRLFDLQGDMEHVKYFKEFIKEYQKNTFSGSNPTVPMVIEFLKNNTSFVKKYDAIRVYGHYSKSTNVTTKMLFSKKINSRQYFELTPAVQLCLFRKTSLNLRERKIVYPSNYISDFVI